MQRAEVGDAVDGAEVGVAQRGSGQPHQASTLVLVNGLISGMVDLHVRNILDEVYERLRHQARENNCSMSAVVLRAVERELERLEWRERLAQRPTMDLDVDAATIIAEERARRDREIG